jgi:microcompartment protein CcmL/EutN
MLSIFREGFMKDLLIWFCLSVLLASLVAAGVGLVADRYFAKTVEGLIGDQGEYDLLFQVRTDLKETAVARIREIIKEKVPGSTVKVGVSVAGKTAVFVGLAPKYRTKAVYTNLPSYFRDIPGSGGFSLMTEPRLTLSAVPANVVDLFIREAERIPGVRFAFRDGGSIAVILEKAVKMKTVQTALEEILASYSLLEIRFPSGYHVENTIEVGRNLSELLAGKGGVSLIRNVTSGKSSDDQEALMLTMAEMKRFLLSYAGQVKVIPAQGAKLHPGDQLVLFDDEEHPRQAGEKVHAEDVIVKITSEEQDGALAGLIIQGDSASLPKAAGRLLDENQKTGAVVANIVINSPKQQLAEALDETINFLSQFNSFQELPSQARQVITAAETIQAALNSINGLGADQADLEKLGNLSALLAGTGNELQKMADHLARLRWVEDQLAKAIGGLEGVQVITRLGFIPRNLGYLGGLGQTVGRLDEELQKLVADLRAKAQTLDDFINRFNPLVQTLLDWEKKTTKLAGQLDQMETLLGGNGGAFQALTELTGMTDHSLRQFAEFDFAGLREGLAPLEAGFDELQNNNLMLIIGEMEKIKTSLPKLKDEEISKTIGLLDRYLGGETLPGEKVELFVNAGYNEAEVTRLVHNFFDSDQVRIQVLPAGILQPDVRNEVTRLLGEVQGVIAALAVIILAVLIFLQDQAPILALLHHLDLLVPYRKGKGKKGKELVLDRIWPGLYASGLGAAWLWTTVKLSGAHIPYFPSPYFLVVGALFGLLFYRMAEKFHRLNLDEVIAGYALGFNFTTVMREIVIPAGRPGLMQKLNRRKMVMK